jgi:hypothetical protein
MKKIAVSFREYKHATQPHTGNPEMDKWLYANCGIDPVHMPHTYEESPKCSTPVNVILESAPAKDCRNYYITDIRTKGNTITLLA